MASKINIPIEAVMASMDEADRRVAKTVHDLAAETGFNPVITQSNKKDDFFKVEYKKPKVKDPLYILHVNGEKWSLRCKLFHLDQYMALLNELNADTLRGLLDARPCRGESAGCTVGIRFSLSGHDYLLCRHGMHFRGLTMADVPPVWALLRAESQYRTV